MTTMSQWPFSYHNGTTTPCPSLSLPVPLREQNADKSAVLSPPVPPCPPVALKENDYEQRRSQVRVLPSALQKALRLQDKPGPTVSLLRCPEGAHRQAASSLGIVEDDTEGVAFAGAQRAHAVADVYPVVATLTFDGAVLVGKDQHLALIEVDGLPDRLRPGALGDK